MLIFHGTAKEKSILFFFFFLELGRGSYFVRIYPKLLPGLEPLFMYFNPFHKTTDFQGPQLSVNIPASTEGFLLHILFYFHTSKEIPVWLCHRPDDTMNKYFHQ